MAHNYFVFHISAPIVQRIQAGGMFLPPTYMQNGTINLTAKSAWSAFVASAKNCKIIESASEWVIIRGTRRDDKGIDSTLYDLDGASMVPATSVCE